MLFRSEDLLQKGLINPVQAFQRHRRLKAQSLLFLVYTNGGRTPKTKGLARIEGLAKRKEAYLADVSRQIAARVGQESPASYPLPEATPA